MNLYQSSHTPEFDFQLFRQPPAVYRGAPLWSWNSKLEREQLLRKIEVFKQMGMGGFHIHVRTGLDTEYLGEEFMDLVRLCVERARQEGLYAWLYDEDRWPSGAAGGLVTTEPAFRAKHLLWTCVPYGGVTAEELAAIEKSAHAARTESGRVLVHYSERTENGRLLARYAVTLQQEKLAHYRRLAEGEAATPGETVWYAYLETVHQTPWFNDQTYVDTLQPAAIRRFLQATHERYARVVGEHFGSTIPAIFTDEPQMIFTEEPQCPYKQVFRFASEQRDLLLPWTDDLPATYQQAYGFDLLETLPELFWELPDGQVSLTRYYYRDHLSERFAQAFADTIGSWCQQHGLALTGHLMEEPTLTSQVQALGEAMRSYRSFGLPGIDMLCDAHEYTTAKQAQSAAHQFGRPGVLSELYGVTYWDFDFVGHKAQGDWQAALGVTMRVHHLNWLSMAGEAKRDYPAPIDAHSPWYEQYPLIEDHFARLNTALTRGKALVRIGVIHPIESFWLCFGPLEQTATERAEREQAFAELTRWLLSGLLDFDFIAESLLPSLCPSQQQGAQLRVGEAQYDVVIVPALRTIRSSTLDRLEAFHEAGGTLMFAGEIPSLVDARPSSRAHQLAAASYVLPWRRQQILEALEAVREVEVRLADGRRAETLLHQVRVDGQRRFLFFCNTDRTHALEHTRIRIQGSWRVTVLETLTGDSFRLDTTCEQGQTLFSWSFPAHGSLLLLLEPGWQPGGIPQPHKSWREVAHLQGPVPVTLSEPNVLLLDQARYRLDEEPWQPLEEVLRIDNRLRQRLGYPLKMEAIAQPWTDRERRPPTHRVSLAFSIQVAHAVPAPRLALENATQTRIWLDGQPVPSAVDGYFVDEAIQTVALPALAVGAHELLLEMPYDRHSNLEWCYLLGDFGVEVAGRQARIVAPVRTLSFGDWTRQGLPFYAGNVTYHCTFEGQENALAVRVPHFKAPLLTVALDGHPRAPIAFAPFQCELGQVEPGPHTLEITAYGNRVNAFGCIHNADKDAFWFGPGAWRTEGDGWSYEYRLKPMGLLSAPRIYVHQPGESD